MDDEMIESIFTTLLLNGVFDVGRDYVEYTNMAIILKSQGYLITPHVNTRMYELSELGKEVLKCGGWKVYREQQELNAKMALEKAKHDLKISKRNSKWGWLPYLISVLAFITSVIAISIAYQSYKVAKSKKLIELKSIQPKSR